MTPAEKKAIRPILHSAWNPVIVELGAHRGEEAAEFRAMLAVGSTMRHIMVEPDPYNCAHIEVRNDARVIRAAITAKSGAMLFYPAEEKRTGMRWSGSLLKPTGHLKKFPTIKFADPIIVWCTTLDDICEQGGLKTIDLLWSDVQGGERAMIQGGRGALRHTRYLFMEVEEKEMYAGQALKSELLSMLPGWMIMADLGSNVLMRNLKC